jgi:integrase
MGIKFDTAKQKWVASYCKRNPRNGQPVSLKRLADTEREAKVCFNEVVLEVERRLSDAIVPTWINAVDGYLGWCRGRGLTEKSVYNAEKCLKAATLPRWKGIRVDEITAEMIRELVCGTYSQHSPTHRKGILKFIRGVFAYLIETGALSRNPCPSIKFRMSDKIKNVLTEVQVKTFLNCALEYRWAWYPHCAMAIYTGMRNGELYALTWDKVNLDIRQIKVDCSWNNKDGFKSTKSGDDRIVEIAPPLVPLLRELRLASGQDEFVLPRLARWSKGEQARELRNFLMPLGLPQIRFHDLRATWATIMLGRGVEPAKVMIMGGWKDMKTMMIYLRKAGISIRGNTDGLALHDPLPKAGQVINIGAFQNGQ